MSNNNAVGEDGITDEMIKYDPDELHQEIANRLNEIFEAQRSELNAGEAVLPPISSQTNREVRVRICGQ